MHYLAYRSIRILINLIELLILFRIIMSYINLGRGNPFSTFVYELTEPVLAPARLLLAKTGINTGMIDFSPLVAILILRFAAHIARIILL